MEPAAPVLDPMAQTALRSLKDIAVPAPVSWMPQTWGWALLGFLLLAGLLAALLLRLRRYRADAYRREALRRLAEIEKRIPDPLSRRQALGDLASLLKRTALAAWPRREVARLSGEEWADFLHGHGNENAGHALERLVDDLEYHGNDVVGTLPSNVCDDMVRAARTWIDRHHVSA